MFAGVTTHEGSRATKGSIRLVRATPLSQGCRSHGLLQRMEPPIGRIFPDERCRLLITAESVDITTIAA